MKKSIAELKLSGLTNMSAEEFVSKFDPILVEEATLIIRNIHGEEVEFTVEDLFTTAIEDYEDEWDEDDITDEGMQEQDSQITSRST